MALAKRNSNVNKKPPKAAHLEMKGRHCEQSCVDLKFLSLFLRFSSPPLHSSPFRLCLLSFRISFLAIHLYFHSFSFRFLYLFPASFSPPLFLSCFHLAFCAGKREGSQQSLWSLFIYGEFIFLLCFFYFFSKSAETKGQKKKIAENTRHSFEYFFFLANFSWYCFSLFCPFNYLHMYSICNI